MLNLDTKERLLLEDEKSHEQLCVEKYKEYSCKACEPALKELFSSLQKKEQQHLDSINQMLQGTIPSTGTSQQSGSQSSSSNMNSVSSSMESYSEEDKAHDKMLCQDSLSTEKYVSSTYNTAIFEFKDKKARQLLNHIQKEEQEHGEALYNYMAQHGMYN